MPGTPDQTLLPARPRAMGMILEEVSPDLVVGILDVTEEHGNRNGVMHGGAIMAFADALYKRLYRIEREAKRERLTPAQRRQRRRSRAPTLSGRRPRARRGEVSG